MTLILRISLLAGILIYMALVLAMLKKKSFILKYALIWFVSALVLLLLDIFPQAIVFIATLMGFQLTANAIFILIIFFILLVLISLTSIVSKQHNDIKRLVQTVSILNEELEKIKYSK